MKQLITENKFMFGIFTLIIVGFLYMEIEGFSFVNTLSSELEKPTGNTYSHGLHHK